jgi:hypothetical protein
MCKEPNLFKQRIAAGDSAFCFSSDRGKSRLSLVRRDCKQIALPKANFL